MNSLDHDSHSCCLFEVIPTLSYHTFLFSPTILPTRLLIKQLERQNSVVQSLRDDGEIFSTPAPIIGVNGSLVVQSLQNATTSILETGSGTEEAISLVAGDGTTLKISRDQLEEIKEVFATFDKDSNQSLSPNELQFLMRFLGQNPSISDIHKLINQVDQDGNGELNCDEFAAFVTERLRKPMSESSKVAELKEVFRVFRGVGPRDSISDTADIAVEGAGGSKEEPALGVAELAKVVRVGLELTDVTDEEICAMLQVADSKGDGRLRWQDFVAVMTCVPVLPSGVGGAAGATTTNTTSGSSSSSSSSASSSSSSSSSSPSPSATPNNS